jgi:hypothetical protein
MVGRRVLGNTEDAGVVVSERSPGYQRNYEDSEAWRAAG